MYKFFLFGLDFSNMTDTCENDYGKDADTQKEKQDICPDHIFGELFLCDMYPNDNIWL